MVEELKIHKKTKWTIIALIVFSLMLVVIALFFTLRELIFRRINVSSSDLLVSSVATAITTYHTKTWTWNAGTPSEPLIRAGHMFDLNRDNQIDGYAALVASSIEDGGFPKDALASGYTGFIKMAQPQIKKSFINRQGIPIDAWGRPLRIAFAAKAYGNQGFGVWSAGPDGVDSTDDDLRSWTPIP